MPLKLDSKVPPDNAGAYPTGPANLGSDGRACLGSYPPLTGDGKLAKRSVEACQPSEEKPLFNKILGKVTTALSVLGIIGGIVSFVGSFFFPPIAIVGIIALSASLLSLACDALNRATDPTLYASERNKALRSQILGSITSVVTAILSIMFPISILVLYALKAVGSLLSLFGFYTEVQSDYTNRRICEEYPGFLANLLQKIFKKICD